MDLLNLEIIDLNKVDFNKYFQQELIQIKEFENQGLLTFDKKGISIHQRPDFKLL